MRIPQPYHLVGLENKASLNPHRLVGARLARQSNIRKTAIIRSEHADIIEMRPEQIDNLV